MFLLVKLGIIEHAAAPHFVLLLHMRDQWNGTSTSFESYQLVEL